MIDCECYRFIGRLFYREVSIFEMDTCSFVSLQCYAEHTPRTIDWVEQVNKQQDINMGFTV